MLVASAIAGVLIIFSVLLDVFETVVLPRRVQRMVLSQNLDSVAQDLQQDQVAQPPRERARLFWSAVADFSASPVGGGFDLRFRSAAIWRRGTRSAQQ